VGAAQPLDAAARVLDGGLLGARDTHWVSTTSIAVSILSWMSLLAVKRLNLGVPGLWFTFKLSAFGTLTAAGVRYLMPGGPFGRRQPALEETALIAGDRQAVLDPRITLSSGSLGSTDEGDQ
jgi:hypothetical protein